MYYVEFYDLQEKMPLLLLSDVVESIVAISEYFEDSSQYFWMHETLLEIYRSFEKEDEIIWPHLIYGLCYASSKVNLVNISDIICQFGLHYYMRTFNLGNARLGVLIIIFYISNRNLRH